MSEQIVGYDRQTISTPFDIKRGSKIVARRTVYIYDQDTGLESPLSLASGAGASDIVWHLILNRKKSQTPVLKKSLAVGGITRVGDGSGGKYDLTLNNADTKDLTPGLYLAMLAVVVSGQRFKFEPYVVNVQATPDLGE